MQVSNTPTKLPVPFANTAGVSYIRSVPTNSQIGVVDGAASLADGFPPLTATPLVSGGVPPSIKDFNGILNVVSAWSRWAAAGNATHFDSSFATAIGGYPKGAVLHSSTVPGVLWVSMVDNNTVDPNGTPGANWQAVRDAQTLSGQPASYYTNIVARLGYTPLNVTAYTAADVLAKLLTVDGAGSGLDADLLDGQSSAFYLAASAYNAADVLNKLLTVDGAGSGIDADLLDGQQGAYYLPASAYTAADVRAKLLTVDGSGSGIDADLLDGWDRDTLRQWGNLIGMPFAWVGQGGQPAWVWGGNAQNQYFVWNPANFSVNYANSAGYAPSAGNADTVDGLHAASFALANQFSSGSNGNGYWRRTPDGNGGQIVEQWGKLVGNYPAGFYTFNFPIAFPTGCEDLQLTILNTTGNQLYDTWVQQVSASATGASFVINFDAGGNSNWSTGVSWRAIGR